MLTDLELDSMRATSTSALPDTGTVTRSAEGGTLNPTTGIWTPAASTTIYTGAMRVRPPTANEMSVLFGDEQVTRQRFVATLPHDAAQVLPGDRLTLSTSSDDQVGVRQFEVKMSSGGSFHVDRRLALEVIE